MGHCCRLQSGSAVQTSRNLHVSRKVVSLWVKRYTSTGGVKELRKPGRKPAVGVSAAERAVQLLTDGNKNNARQVANALQGGLDITSTSPHHRDQGCKEGCKQQWDTDSVSSRLAGKAFEQ